MFVSDGIPILPVVALWERGSQISHYVRSRVVYPENVQRLIGLMHKELCFFIQASAIDRSLGVTIDHFGDNMP